VNNQIIALVELVRTNLTDLQMKNISPLIVQGVHEREIIKNLDTIDIKTILE